MVAGFIILKAQSNQALKCNKILKQECIVQCQMKIFCKFMRYKVFKILLKKIMLVAAKALTKLSYEGLGQCTSWERLNTQGFE